MCIAFNTRYYVRQSEWALSSRLVDRLASGPASHLTYIRLRQMTAFVFANDRDRVCSVYMRIGPYDRVRVCKLTAFVFADVFFKFKSEQVQSGTYLYEEI